TLPSARGVQFIDLPATTKRYVRLTVNSTWAAEGRWYLVNATPDLGDQIEDCPDLHPGPRPRHTPLAGVVLTDAELDHTLGIARLREAADGVDVLATAPVRRALLDGLHLGDVLGPYTTLRWRRLDTAPVPLAEGSTLTVGAVPVSAKRPRYAAGMAADAAGDDAWVVALRLADRDTGRSLLYAPALAVWSDTFQRAAAEADCVIVDGTFWDDEEPRRAGFSTRTATGMGHLPIDGPGGTAKRLAELPARCLYTHLNNTNPLADPAAPQHQELAAMGLEVAADGMVIEL
ncbi:pyrroloquinoline quinone biosynthesis protein PqqB, partial [Streptomyces sp. NPDC059590]|uniref:pyrroloquinoline quinone biosynthesis protein PqqB n=1 Tax=Streptomyces sp. NPDC059590 TaxID=3346877 RepID=UPI00367C2228